MFANVEKLQIKVPAHIDYLGDLRDFVTQIGRKHRFSDKIVNAFKLAVDEAATNIIRHAYRNREGLITIRAIVKKNSLTLSIIDQGTYFDPKRVKDPDLNRYVDIGKKGGLGIFIMRKLMDDIDYRKIEEGNELRITKFRETNEKRNIFRSVSAIPFSIKTKYFFRAIAIITGVIASGYFYFFFKTDDEILANFISRSQLTARQIVNLISSAPRESFSFVEDIVYPIDVEYQGQISRISIEDSTGFIVYSSNPYEIGLEEFKRPRGYEKVKGDVFRYHQTDGETFYEFESPIFIKESKAYYGKAHILFSAQDVEQQISYKRNADMQLALIILGMSYAGVALLIYLVLNPFRKLSDWVQNLGGDGDIEDDVDIDASTEIGEIARAFSDITHKFRDSQKNLADQERLHKEMQVAQEIQQTLLPMEFPELEGYQISAFYEAAKEVGGDYYDFVEVDKDTLGIAVADVSGKGVPGSLVMTMIRTALRTEARGLSDAAEVLARVNDFVANDIKKGMFVTVFYLIIDSKKRRLNYASAGHNPMILYRGSTKQTYYLNPKGFPIGVQLPQKDYFRNYIKSDTIQLAKDDILLLYTDGITEAMNSNRDQYGEGRLQQVLHDHGHLATNQFVERLKDSIYSFTEGAPQYDDITLVSIKEEYTREEDELRRAKEVHDLVDGGMSVRQACESVNLATHVYYNKYKKFFEERGTDAFEIDKTISVEAKHFSIEEKTKIFNIIELHPEYGPGTIRKELNTEKYGFTSISESRIYEELVRNRLNTQPLREAYVGKARRSNRRLKSPGTPFMTLDGKIVIDRPESIDYAIQPKDKEADDADASKLTDKPVGLKDRPENDDDALITAEPDSGIVEEELGEAEELLHAPLEEVLANTGRDSAESAQVSEPTSAHPVGEDEQEPDSGPLRAEVSPSDKVTKESEETGPALNAESESNPEEMLTGDISFAGFFETESVSPEETAATTELAESAEEIGNSETSLEEAESSLEGSQELYEDLGEQEKETVEFSTQEMLHGFPDEESVQEGLDETPETLAAASAEELFGDDLFESDLVYDPGLSEQIQQAEELQAQQVSESEQEDAETQQDVGDEMVSFSDLIQALDDELVYVTEPHNVADVENHTTNGNGVGAPAKKRGGSESNANNVGPELPDEGASQSSHESKETTLINGIKYYKNHDYDRAIREFKRVIDIYPDYKEAHSILGNAYFRNRMYDEAAVEYQRVKELDPEDITAYENMGVIYANRGEYRQAVYEWKTVIELNPDRTDIQDKIRKALRLM